MNGELPENEAGHPLGAEETMVPDPNRASWACGPPWPSTTR